MPPPRVLGFLSAREQGHHSGPMIQIIMTKVVESPMSACGEGTGIYTAPGWRTQEHSQRDWGALKFMFLALQMMPVFDFLKDTDMNEIMQEKRFLLPTDASSNLHFLLEGFSKVAFGKKKCKFCVANWLLWGKILTESAFLGEGQESLVLN